MNTSRSLLSLMTVVSAVLAAGLAAGGAQSQAADPNPVQVAQSHDEGHTDHGDTSHGGRGPRWRGGLGDTGSHGHGGGHDEEGGGGHSDRGSRPEWAGRGGRHTVESAVFHYRPGHDDRGDIHDHDTGGEPGSGGHTSGEDEHSH